MSILASHFLQTKQGYGTRLKRVLVDWKKALSFLFNVKSSTFVLLFVDIKAFFFFFTLLPPDLRKLSTSCCPPLGFPLSPPPAFSSSSSPVLTLLVFKGAGLDKHLLRGAGEDVSLKRGKRGNNKEIKGGKISQKTILLMRSVFFKLGGQSWGF